MLLNIPKVIIAHQKVHRQINKQDLKFQTDITGEESPVTNKVDSSTKEKQFSVLHKKIYPASNVYYFLLT